jgi:hypothetical protein
VTKKAGLKTFGEVRDELPSLLKRLWAAPAEKRADHLHIPAVEGIYLFSERGRPIYVGQSRDIRRRLGDHTRPSGTHYSASFAFLFAKYRARRAGINVDIPRARLTGHRRFNAIFKDAKRRVANMDVRFLPVKDPVRRTVFEVYASLALGTTRFNSFETH